MEVARVRAEASRGLLSWSSQARDVHAVRERPRKTGRGTLPDSGGIDTYHFTHSCISACGPARSA